MKGLLLWIVSGCDERMCCGVNVVTLKDRGLLNHHSPPACDDDRADGFQKHQNSVGSPHNSIESYQRHDFMFSVEYIHSFIVGVSKANLVHQT